MELLAFRGYEALDGVKFSVFESCSFGDDALMIGVDIGLELADFGLEPGNAGFVGGDLSFVFPLSVIVYGGSGVVREISDLFEIELDFCLVAGDLFALEADLANKFIESLKVSLGNWVAIGDTLRR